MRTLVTGGAGFIGSHIVDCLINAGHSVVVLDDLSGGFIENINKDAIFVKGSITDSALVYWLFESYKFHYVYHCAAYAAEGLSHFIRRYNYENNLIGSMNLINASVREEVKCFVFLSSIAVYGSLRPPMRETMTPEPEDPYGIAKYAVELDLAAASRMFDLDYIIFRPHNVYGERQNIGDPYRNVIGIFMNQILQNKPCTIFGDGEQTRAFTHIRDIASTIANSVNYKEAYRQIFNVGSDMHLSVNELAYHVQNAMEKDSGVVHLEARKEVVDAYSDHSKYMKYFPRVPATSIWEGLRLMAGWVNMHGSKSGKQFDNIEVEKNLPNSWKRRVSLENS